MMINLPEEVKTLLNKLHNNNHKAYVCGGAVRDAIIGQTPKDWDICTSARPTEMIKIFKDEKVIPTGLQHGTITVMMNDNPIEITTFRCDGKYSDNRRPDYVEFTTDVIEDLKRRDFTINAMAYNEEEGLIDPFDGKSDLSKRIIRCVGNPEERFDEDALRILRALRFSARLDFNIDNQTAKALTDKRYLLRNISSERINSELCKILMSECCGTWVFRHYPEVFRQIIPELGEMMGFLQNNPHHLYDVWEHTMECMLYELIYEKTDLIVRLAVLLHDVGKPYCYTEDEDGVGHFYGHAKISAEIAEDILIRLRFSNDIKDKVVELIANHDVTFTPTPRAVKKLLNKLGEEQLRRLLLLRGFDIHGQNQYTDSWSEKKMRLGQMYPILNFVIEENECFQLKDLAINGNDLIELGFESGKKIGQILNTLLMAVIDGDIKNKKEKLIQFVKDIYKGEMNE